MGRDQDRRWDGVSPRTAREIYLGENLGPVVIEVNGVSIDVGADGTVKVHPAANDTAAIESTGEHKGEIYGGIFPDGKPGWILEEPKPMTHYDA